MPARRPAQQRRVRCLGVALLILGLGHTPLPAADFHNVRHHDGAGETCQYHAHLLRWHPGTDPGQDVAVLHWHWFLPGGAPGATSPDGGPAFRAHAPDWFEMVWDDGPQFVPDTSSRCLVDRELEPLASPFLLDDLGAVADPVRAGPEKPVRAFTATFAPRVRLISLLQRLTC